MKNSRGPPLRKADILYLVASFQHNNFQDILSYRTRRSGKNRSDTLNKLSGRPLTEHFSSKVQIQIIQEYTN